MKRLVFAIILSSLCFYGFALEFNFKKVYRNFKGGHDYKSKDYENAQKSFEKNSVDYPKDENLHYNLANSLYKNEKYDEALKEYSIALQNNNTKLEHKIYHNIGNAHFQKEEYKEALEAYKKSLISKPNQVDTRKNYELTKRILLQQQENENKSQSKKQEKQENEDQQKQDQDQSQEKKDAESVLKAIEEKEQEQLKKKNQGSGKYKTGKYW